jgi:chemotaxis methyl-accepting protein methylase
MLNSGMINFAKICLNSDLNKYFSLYEKQLLLNQAHIKKPHLHIHEEPVPSEKYDIIIFRNKLLYYKNDYCEHIFINLQSLLSDQGYLITGTRDIIPSHSLSSDFRLMNREERIYQKMK